MFLLPLSLVSPLADNAFTSYEGKERKRVTGISGEKTVIALKFTGVSKTRGEVSMHTCKSKAIRLMRQTQKHKKVIYWSKDESIHYRIRKVYMSRLPCKECIPYGFFIIFQILWLISGQCCTFFNTIQCRVALK